MQQMKGKLEGKAGAGKKQQGLGGGEPPPAQPGRAGKLVCSHPNWPVCIPKTCTSSLSSYPTAHSHITCISFTPQKHLALQIPYLQS